jgi:DNA polymerase delta subunit 1
VLGIENQPLGSLTSLMGYHHTGDTRLFIKVYVAMPSLVPSCKRLFDDGISVGSVGHVQGSTYESNVPYVLRFMIDKDIQGADWLELPAGSYRVLSCKGDGNKRPSSAKNTSRCTLEVEVAYANMIHHPCTGAYSSIPPFRILSFDIECSARKGHFPDASQDPVIQIANILAVQGTDEPLVRTIFTLNTCLPIVGAQVISCQTEEELLMKWRDYVLSIDPDIITGYNIANFDIPYLLNRAKVGCAYAHESAKYQYLIINT